MSPKSKQALQRFISAADDYAFRGTVSDHQSEYSRRIREYSESLKALKEQLK